MSNYHNLIHWKWTYFNHTDHIVALLQYFYNPKLHSFIIAILDYFHSIFSILLINGTRFIHFIAKQCSIYFDSNINCLRKFHVNNNLMKKKPRPGTQKRSVSWRRARDQKNKIYMYPKQIYPNKKQAIQIPANNLYIFIFLDECFAFSVVCVLKLCCYHKSVLFWAIAILCYYNGIKRWEPKETGQSK